NWDPKLLWIGTGTVFSIPFSIILAVVATIVVVLFLGRTRTGRILEAVGNNPRAARLAGVRTGRYRILAYMISGLLSSLGGIVLVARVGRGDINVGSSYLLEAVAATLIGYAVLGANRPNPLGTAIGALFVGVVVNGLTMFNVPYFTQDFIKGALLVVALIVSFSKIFNTRQQED
ncbi:MAG: ABC transporter permease, partial [Bifidobacterium psychraerophilum]